MAAKVRQLPFFSNLGDGDTEGPFSQKEYSDIVFTLPGGRAGLTTEGGFVIKSTNKTGATSVKGTLTLASTTTNNACGLTSADTTHPIGVMYEDGIADGAECWVVISGRCQVKLENNVAATRGYWARTSVTAAGRADATNANPPGGGVVELDAHMCEIGHCLESVSASASGALCYIMLHFN